MHITVCVSAVEVHGRALQHVHGHWHCSLESLSWPLVGVVSLIFSASDTPSGFSWRGDGQQGWPCGRGPGSLGEPGGGDLGGLSSPDLGLDLSLIISKH